MKKEIVNGIEYTYSSEWIKTLESEDHWRLYWKQQTLIQSYVKKKHTILEIGVGTNFTANYLKSKNINVTTFDIDEEKNPDIIGNIVSYNWGKSIKFNHILAFEVFEHIPYTEFVKALKNLNKIVIDNIIISLPLNEKVLFEFEFKIPKFKRKHIRIPIKKNNITTKNHFWEVGYGKYSENFIENMFIEQGYTLINKSKKSNFIYYVISKND